MLFWGTGVLYCFGDLSHGILHDLYIVDPFQLRYSWLCWHWILHQEDLFHCEDRLMDKRDLFSSDQQKTLGFKNIMNMTVFFLTPSHRVVNWICLQLCKKIFGTVFPRSGL